LCWIPRSEAVNMNHHKMRIRTSRVGATIL
jgi:hypothetical protein